MRNTQSRKPRQRAPTKTVPSAQSQQAVYTPLDPPTQICCFICNNNYWTTVSSGKACQLSVTRILTFCDLFFLRDEAERQCLLRLSSLNDPFCTACSHKMNQLQEWIAQLEALQKLIDNLKSDVGQLMVCSFPNSPNIEGTHHLKAKLVQVWNSSSSSFAHQRNPATFQPLHDLVQAAHHHHGSSQGNAQPSTVATEDLFDIEEVVVGNSDDDYFQPDGNDNEEEEDSSESEEPKVKSSGGKKAPKRTREPSVRQSAGEKIEAHPDGRCRLCPSTFKSQIQLAKHIRRAHSGIVHPCRYCDKTFQDTSNRKRHEVSVHISQTRDYVCDKCGKGYRTTWSLRAHEQIAHEGKILKQYRKIPSQCHECGRVCTNLKNLRTHVRLVHKDAFPRTPCTICGRPFKHRQHLKKHERTHMSATDLLNEGKTYFYKCTICPLEGQTGFKAKAGLEEHYATEHPTDPKPKLQTKPMKLPKETFSCPDCPFHKPFSRKAALELHIKSGHAPKGGLAGKHGKNCRICGKPCRSSTSAVEHQGTHHPSVYVCTLCPFSNSRKLFLARHFAKEHRGVKLPKTRILLNMPYKQYFCPECPDHPGFSQKERMRTHMMAHRLGTLHELDESEEYKEEPEEEEEEEPVVESEDSEDEESDESEYASSSSEEEVKETKKILSPSFSRRGRVLHPPKRYRPSSSATLHSLGLEKDVEIPLERIDQNWPKGRVKRIKTTTPLLDAVEAYAEGSFKEDDDIGPGDIGHEEIEPFLVTVDHALKQESLSLPAFFDESLPATEDFILS